MDSSLATSCTVHSFLLCDPEVLLHPFMHSFTYLFTYLLIVIILCDPEVLNTGDRVILSICACIILKCLRLVTSRRSA